MIALWIFFWWLLGLLILGAATWRDWRVKDFRRVEVGDVIGLVFFPLIWPVVIAFIAIEDNWLDLPVFDLNWFRREKDDE